MSASRRHRLFAALMVAMVVVVSALAVTLFLDLRNPSPLSGVAPEQAYRRLAGQVAGIYDTVPDPTVARILQRGVVKTEAATEIRSNNAGMRNAQDYGTKAVGVYRVVFLGDSFTYGFGGPEEDRYSNQLATWLEENKVRVEGDRIEVINLSIGSWTALNEARYLTTRLSEYAPDLVVVLMVRNDISDTQGVRGIGALSNAFSPEHRQRASGVFNDAWPTRFGVASINLLGYDLAPESRMRWREAAFAMRRLEELQLASGGRMLFTVLRENPYFEALVHHYFKQVGILSPVALVDYRPESGTTVLAHDPHPNRSGHQLLAAQTLEHLRSLGWLEAPSMAPASAPMPPLWESPSPNAEELLGLRRQLAEQYLQHELDFQALKPNETPALLGGILPDRDAPDPLRSAPHVAPYGAFLLRHLASADSLLLQIYLPERRELYPLELTVALQGMESRTFVFSAQDSPGERVLRVPLPAHEPDWPGLEVRLEASRYYAGITDHRTRSVRLLRAWQE